MTRLSSVFSKRAGRIATLLCALLLAASALPLYAISFYNHPYYDDFGFSARTHSAWLETGSVGNVLKAALESAAETRNTWQGTYTGTLLSNVQPGVFSERLYFIGTFLLLTAFLFCFWFFFSTVFGPRGLGLQKQETATLSCLTLALVLQFMPDTGEAFFWFNGGIGNVFVYSLLALAAALLMRLYQAESARQMGWLTAALALCMVLLGGGSYGGGLFGLCVLGLTTLWLFARKHPRKWAFLGLWLLFLGCFLYSVSAPGNGVRAGVIGSHPSPVKAVAQALYYGAALMGSYLRLPLLGLTALVLPFFYRAARKSPLSFNHPWLALLLLGGLYCTQLAPPLYGGVFIGGGRIVNTYWISFVALWLLYAFYVTGFAVKGGKLRGLTWGSDSADGKKRMADEPAVSAKPAVNAIPGSQGETAERLPALRRGLIALGCCLALVGCLAYKGEDDALYGAQNLSGISATLSLLNGEAAQYHREMSAREALLNDAAQPSVTLAPLTATPRVFMNDLLVPGAPYDVRPSLLLYYGKVSIAVEGEGSAK